MLKKLKLADDCYQKVVMNYSNNIVVMKVKKQSKGISKQKHGKCKMFLKGHTQNIILEI